MERYQGEEEAKEDDGANEQYYDCEEGEEAEKEEESEGDELEGKRNHFSGRRTRSSVHMITSGRSQWRTNYKIHGRTRMKPCFESH
jgi:hypothetical protein